MSASSTNHGADRAGTGIATESSTPSQMFLTEPSATRALFGLFLCRRDYQIGKEWDSNGNTHIHVRDVDSLVPVMLFSNGTILIQGRHDSPLRRNLVAFCHAVGGKVR
jgi:hypothetical protein